MLARLKYKSAAVTMVALTATLLLSSGAQAAKRHAAEPRQKTPAGKTIDIPLYNVITDTILQMTPEHTSKQDQNIMKHMCSLASGELARSDAIQALLKDGTDVQKLVQGNDKAAALLAAGSDDEVKAGCATWLVTLLFENTDPGKWYSVKVETPAKGTTDDKKTPESKPVKTFDEAAFTQDAMQKLVIAQGTAQFYGLIAASITAEPVAAPDLGAYRQRISALTIQYAGKYLNTLKALGAAQTGNKLVVQEITADGWFVSDMNGNEFSQRGHVVSLKNRGTDWFGSEKIMGKTYYASLGIE